MSAFATAMRSGNSISGPTAAKKWRLAPRSAAGSGFASTRTIAAARMPIAVCGGGIEEWPPSALAVSDSVT